MRLKRIVFTLFIRIFTIATVTVQAQIYNADFSNNNDGFTDHTSSNPPITPPTDGQIEVGPFGALGNQWYLSYDDKPSTDGTPSNSFKVVNDSLVSNDWGGQGIFQSQKIDVSKINSVDISSLTINSRANDDKFKYFYILDEGSRVETSNYSSNNTDELKYSISVDVSSAQDLKVGFEFSENGSNSGYKTSYFKVSETINSNEGITTSKATRNTKEDGTSATFTVALTKQPATDVVLNITSGNSQEITVSPSTLTFSNSNWNTPQTITATGVDDNNKDGDKDVTIKISVDDLNSDDAYDTVPNATIIITNEDNEEFIIINEFLADPHVTNGDANGDGVVGRYADEFIEIYNNSNNSINLTNFTIEVNDALKHTFPKGTIFPKGSIIVVFGGGTPKNIPSLTQVASTGRLDLLNAGSTIAIKNSSGTIITSYTYEDEGGNDVALARNSDVTGSFVAHNTIANNTAPFSPGRKNVDNIPFSKTWTGATNNDWDTASNWDSNSPPSNSNSDNIWIPSGLTDYPTASSALTFNHLTINSGTSFIPKSTVTGSVTFNRKLTSNWHLVSAPISGESMQDIISNHTFLVNSKNKISIANYDNTQVNDTWDYKTASSSENLISGEGYSVKLASDENLSFTGSINTDDVQKSVADQSYNLVGNPFTASLNSTKFINTNASKLSEKTLWAWEGDSYITYNIVNPIIVAPTQGFFIEAVLDGNVEFSTSSLSHHSSDNFKKPTEVSYFELFFSDGIKNTSAKVFFVEGKTTSFDNGYDSKVFESAGNNFYAYTQILKGNSVSKLAIQTLPKKNYESYVIPLGLKISGDEEITITAKTSNLPSDLNVILEDRLANKFTCLKEANTKYVVNINHQDELGRFYIHTKQNALALETAKNTLKSISIYKSSDLTLKIVGLTERNVSIKLFNIFGREVYNAKISSSEETYNILLPKLSKGLYFVELQVGNGKIIRKIIL